MVVGESVVGSSVGVIDGSAVGSLLGASLGPAEGETVGVVLGASDGDDVGAALASADGAALGSVDGACVGIALGVSVGVSVGAADGTSVGLAEGAYDGVSCTAARTVCRHPRARARCTLPTPLAAHSGMERIGNGNNDLAQRRQDSMSKRYDITDGTRSEKNDTEARRAEAKRWHEIATRKRSTQPLALQTHRRRGRERGGHLCRR